MYRVDHPTAAGVIPTPGALGTQGYFTDGNPGTSTPATIVPADWLNMVQEELMNVILAASLTASKTTRNQVLAAINALIAGATGAGALQAQAGNYVTAGGTANAITATLTPALTGHVAGLPIRVKLTATNTGATTFNPNAVGAIAVQNPDGGALIAGDLVNGQIAYLMYDGTVYRLLNYRRQMAVASEMETPSSSVKAVSPALQHRHASAVKAWVEYDNNGESGTTEADYGVSSLTDNGVGEATVNFASAFSSVAYAAVGSASTGSGGAQAQGLRIVSSATKLAGSCRHAGFSVTDAATAQPDMDYNFVMFAGDL